MNDVPIFAIVGHPNEGKSSLVSTLTEEDRVPISSIPGETKECANYAINVDGEVLLRFVDTPGFQMPVQTLKWMKRYSGPPEMMVEEFIRAHQSDTRYSDDCELLRPVANNAGIIYVVDGSRPLRPNDEAEMEILRLSGRPRMAVINPKTEKSSYISKWKSAFAKTFNVTHQFNTHHATFKERINLLEALKPIEQDWSSAIDRVINELKSDWRNRLNACADAILFLLDNSLKLSLAETSKQEDVEERKKQREEIIQSFLKKLSNHERQCQQELKSRFQHNVFNADLVAETIVAKDLFSEETWRALGLTHKQLAWTFVTAGATSGAALDIFFAHLTFGIFTLSGAILGGIAGWKGVRPLGRLRVKIGPFTQELGDHHIKVGPLHNPQLLFVLLDRVLIYFQCVSNWAHARREYEPISQPSGKQGFTAGWDKKRRQYFEKYQTYLQAEKLSKADDMRIYVREQLVEALNEIHGSKSL